MTRKSCPSEFGEHALALELPSNYSKGIPAQKACVSVRGALKWDTFDCVLHRQKAVPGLLDADVLPFFGTKVVISKQDRLFVHQTQGSADPGKVCKFCDGH